MTIVILIILATISVSVVLGEGGLIGQAQDAKKQVEDAQEKEKDDMNLLAQEYANIMAENKEQNIVPEIPEEPESVIIQFTVGGVTYQAEEGMTWREWIEKNGADSQNGRYWYYSDKEPLYIWINDGGENPYNVIMKNETNVKATDIIINNYTYLIKRNIGGGGEIN